MRIAIFSECYRPWINGAVTSIVTLREALRAAGHTVTLFAPGWPQQDDDADVFRLPALPFPAHPYHYARPFPPLPVDFATLKVDIIHSQHPFTVGHLGAGLARRHHIPLIYTVHAQYDLLAQHATVPMLRAPGAQVARALLRRYCARAHTIIAPSQHTADALRSLGVNGRIAIVPSSVPPLSCGVESRAEVRTYLGIEATTPVLLYVGRLCPVKHLDLLMYAVARLQTHALPYPAGDFRLLLVGSGPARIRLEALAASLNIRDRVHFVGDQPHATIGRWYAAGDIFTLPSPSETQGLVLIEAMMAGLPCVAIDEGGPCEIVQQGVTGWRVPLNAEAFASAIENLLCSPQTCARFAMQARQRAVAFSATAMADGILEIYAVAQSPE